LTINFSGFLAGSGGLVTSAGLTLPFSGAGVAAPDTPEITKSETEMMRQIRIDLLVDLDLIGLPRSERLLTRLSTWRRGLFYQNLKTF
jgi:hypothetical protein